MAGLIYHITLAAEWERQAHNPIYVADSLASEGFIHCTGQLDLLVTVANRFYAQEPGDFLILAVDPVRLRARVEWEFVDGARFPHVYGPINRDAVVAVTPFPRAADGAFQGPTDAPIRVG